MKNFFSIFLLLLIAFFVYTYFSPQVIPVKTEKNVELKDTLSVLSISFVGDLMCHSTQFNYAHVKDDSFDFSGTFSEVKKYLTESDLTIGNFETVLAGREKGYHGYPYFNAPDDFLFAIKNAGFNFLVTANNHSLDQGEKGILRTLQKMNNAKINHTGTYFSENDRDSIRILNVNNFKLAILNYSYGTNGVPVPKGKSYLISLINFTRIKNEISEAKENGAELVLVFFHFGEEYEREPNRFQRQVVDSTIKFGADLIIGSHPHVVQPVNYFITNHAALDTGFVAYSLGNFISNQRWRFSDSGVILKMKLVKNLLSGKIKISNINFIPTWVFRGSIKDKKAHVILPVNIQMDDSLYSYLTKNDKRKLQQAKKDVLYILNKYLRGKNTTMLTLTNKNKSKADELVNFHK